MISVRSSICRYIPLLKLPRWLYLAAAPPAVFSKSAPPPPQPLVIFTPPEADVVAGLKTEALKLLFEEKPLFRTEPDNEGSGRRCNLLGCDFGSEEPVEEEFPPPPLPLLLLPVL